MSTKEPDNDSRNNSILQEILDTLRASGKPDNDKRKKSILQEILDTVRASAKPDNDSGNNSILKEILQSLRASGKFPTPPKNSSSPFWMEYHRIAVERDEDFVERHGNNMDVLLIFAGLFSTVGSAFIVGMQSNLSPDPSDTTNNLLRLLIRTMDNQTTPIPALIPTTWSGPSANTILFQCLAYAGLSLSLLAALGAVLAKQWITHFKISRWGSGGLTERCTQHQHVFDAVRKWHFDAVVGALPILLQLSLLLFFVALSGQVWMQQRTVGSVLIAATVTGVVGYAVTLYASLVDADCPYRTPVTGLCLTVWEAMRYLLVRWLRGSSSSDFKEALVFPYGTSHSTSRRPMRAPEASTKVQSMTSASERTKAHFGLRRQSVRYNPLSAICWVLETSTDLDILIAALEMLLTVDFPEDYDFSSLYKQIEDFAFVSPDWPYSRTIFYAPPDGIVLSAAEIKRRQVALRALMRIQCLRGNSMPIFDDLKTLFSHVFLEEETATSGSKNWHPLTPSVSTRTLAFLPLLLFRLLNHQPSSMGYLAHSDSDLGSERDIMGFPSRVVDLIKFEHFQDPQSSPLDLTVCGDNLGTFLVCIAMMAGISFELKELFVHKKRSGHPTLLPQLLKGIFQSSIDNNSNEHLSSNIHAVLLCALIKVVPPKVVRTFLHNDKPELYSDSELTVLVKLYARVAQKAVLPSEESDGQGEDKEKGKGPKTPTEATNNNSPTVPFVDSYARSLLIVISPLIERSLLAGRLREQRQALHGYHLLWAREPIAWLQDLDLDAAAAHLRALRKREDWRTAGECLFLINNAVAHRFSQVEGNPSKGEEKPSDAQVHDEPASSTDSTAEDRSKGPQAKPLEKKGTPMQPLPEALKSQEYLDNLVFFLRGKMPIRLRCSALRGCCDVRKHLAADSYFPSESGAMKCFAGDLLSMSHFTDEGNGVVLCPERDLLYLELVGELTARGPKSQWWEYLYNKRHIQRWIEIAHEVRKVLTAQSTKSRLYGLAGFRSGSSAEHGDSVMDYILPLLRILTVFNPNQPEMHGKGPENFIRDSKLFLIATKTYTKYSKLSEDLLVAMGDNEPEIPKATGQTPYLPQGTSETARSEEMNEKNNDGLNFVQKLGSRKDDLIEKLRRARPGDHEASGGGSKGKTNGRRGQQVN